MRLAPVLFRLALVCALAFSLAASCFAQVPLDASRLPSDTGFYFIWHGTPAGDTRKDNSLFALWDDPDFAPIRSAFVQALLDDSKSKKTSSTQTPLTKEELTQFASLLDNSFVMAYFNQPDDFAAKSKAGPDEKAPQWDGMFFVYDRTGKEALLSKAVLRARSGNGEIPKLSEITVAGVKALKVDRKSGTTYWAETGKFAVAASNPDAFERALTLVTTNSTPHPLSETHTWQEAKPFLGSGFAEFFFRVPDLKRLMSPEKPAGDPMAAQAKALADSLRLDVLHSVAGQLTLEGNKTRFRAAILGDTAPGSVFDLWAAGETSPGSLVFLTPDTISYNEWHFDFAGVYAVLRKAIFEGSAQGPQVVGMIEGMSESRLGMPIKQALTLPTGEIASIQNSPILDEARLVRIVGITSKPDSLKLLRSIEGDKVSSELAEGSTTYVKVSAGGSESKAGLAQWKFYHLAFTPNFLLGSWRKDALQPLAAPAPASAVTLPQAFTAARSQFPDKLNGIAFFDFQKVDWPGMKQQWITEIKKADAASKSTDDSSLKTIDLLNLVDPAVFPRHLHALVGASWKDPKGVYFDEWLN